MLTQFVLWLKTFVVKDEEGQTLVEYALIIALIAVVVIAILTTLGGGVRNIFTNVSDAIGGAGG